MKHKVTEIRRRREALGVTCTDLAMAADVNYWALVRWDKGAGRPGVKNAKRLAVALGCEPEDLIEARAEPTPLEVAR